uniref:Uncharacterized protein n=1 Tax=Arundo donax TaxID=35708 RepID=A0A0A8ZSV7_ARUDO
MGNFGKIVLKSTCDRGALEKLC